MGDCSLPLCASWVGGLHLNKTIHGVSITPPISIYGVLGHTFEEKGEVHGPSFLPFRSSFPMWASASKELPFFDDLSFSGLPICSLRFPLRILCHALFPLPPFNRVPRTGLTASVSTPRGDTLPVSCLEGKVILQSGVLNPFSL